MGGTFLGILNYFCYLKNITEMGIIKNLGFLQPCIIVNLY